MAPDILRVFRERSALRLPLARAIARPADPSSAAREPRPPSRAPFRAAREAVRQRSGLRGRRRLTPAGLPLGRSNTNTNTNANANTY